MKRNSHIYSPIAGLDTGSSIRCGVELTAFQNPKSQIPNRIRRGFNLVEMLIALAITAALLTSVMVALHASVVAYQTTTEEASTNTISRLVMNRMLTLIRTGTEFGPYPTDPLDLTVESDFMEFMTSDGRVITLEWKESPEPTNGYPQGEALYVTVDEGGNASKHLLLEGVKAQYVEDENNQPVKVFPFRLQYEKGRKLYRATIDLAVVPDDNMSVQLDGNNTNVIRLVASAMPRVETY